MKTFKLNNGVEMPKIGIGTFLLEPKDAESSVKFALENGYHLVDTANAYCNERAVGRGIKLSGMNREDVFVSTKLWPTEYENEHAIDETLERLGLDYIDLLFLHQPAGNWEKGYKMIEAAYKAGKVKSIGVSNFEGQYIEKLLTICEIKPQVIQVECHPFYPQTELRKITDTENIRIMSWYPLGGKGMTADLLDSQIVKDIAKKYGKSSAQVVLRWHVQMGFVTIPGSKNPEHIKANIDIFDFELSQEDMDNMGTLNIGKRRYTRTEKALEDFAKWQPTFEKE